MVEAFYQASSSIPYNQSNLAPKLRELFYRAKPVVERAVERAVLATEAQAASVRPPSSVSGSQSTPPMLPSPVSIVSANSANSTPTNRNSGTPSSNDSSLSMTTAYPLRDPASDAASGAPGRPPIYELKADPHPIAASTHISIDAKLIHSVANATTRIAQVTENMSQAQDLISLRVLAEHYPRTFARMIHSTLGRCDEKEPDFEDEDGELFWPGAPFNGEGLAWVCLMGKAMIMEFGKDYDYKSVEGAIPKPSGSTRVRR